MKKNNSSNLFIRCVRFSAVFACLCITSCGSELQDYPYERSGFICFKNETSPDPQREEIKPKLVNDGQCRGVAFKEAPMVKYLNNKSGDKLEIVIQHKNLMSISGVSVKEEHSDLKKHFRSLMLIRQKDLGFSLKFEPELNLFSLEESSKEKLRIYNFFDSDSAPEFLMDCGYYDPPPELISWRPKACSVWMPLTSELSVKFWINRTELKNWKTLTAVLKEEILKLTQVD